MSRNSPLPIDALLPKILAAMQRSASVVLEAAPGAGKTTRVPAAMLPIVRGEILVLEPRRIAARMAARRVAEELGEKPGVTIGYTVRFEQVGGEATRLRFMTEGVLTRRLQSSPELRGVDMVILDEFHERHLDTDLALTLLRRLQRTTRPDLKLLVMSATIDTGPVAAFLDSCPILRSEGRSFPLEIEHLRYSSLPLETQVSNALASVVTRSSGDTLIFLPGAAEIRRSIAACADIGRRYGIDLLPLHGDLPPAEQDRAVAPGPQRKAIFATNVAESSITIDGVTTVIDSGLARIAATSPWTGLPTLEIGRVSQASLRQRAGRAGRTGPGLAVRLFPEEDLQRRPAFDIPEVLRADLSQLLLTLQVLGIRDAHAVDWLDTPPQAALDAAATLLDRLGAAGDQAMELAHYPLPPRLAKILTEAKTRGAAHSACIAVALLSTRLAAGNLLEAVDHPPLDHRFRQQLRQLLRLVEAPHTPEHNDVGLLQSLLAGFFDRAARLRSDRQLLLSTGISAELAGDLPKQDFLLAVDAEDRKEKPLPLVRVYAPLEAEWLIDLFPERVRDVRELVWNRAAERVEEVSRLVYDELVLSESRQAPTELEAAAEMLAKAALDTGLARFVDAEQLENLIARIEFSGGPEPDVAGALRDICEGLRSFTELKNAATADLIPLLEQRSGVRLHELAPASLRLQGGRTAKVHYERGKPPWIASRLQDFFGMHETPRIGPAKTPVVLHLLAPNQRAVQTTSDLAGFWERLYPSVRRELMRRYPRHSWPESPR